MSLANERLSLLKVAALYFDKWIILDPVAAGWATVGADHVARSAITLLKDAGRMQRRIQPRGLSLQRIGREARRRAGC